MTFHVEHPAQRAFLQTARRLFLGGRPRAEAGAPNAADDQLIRVRADGHLPGGITRRRFFFLGAAAGITLAAPPIPLQFQWFTEPPPIPCGVDLSAVDAVFKEIYRPLIVEQLQEQNLLSRLFQQEERAILSMGRQVLWTHTDGRTG